MKSTKFTAAPNCYLLIKIIIGDRDCHVVGRQLENSKKNFMTK